MKNQGIDIRIRIGVGKEYAGKRRDDWKYFDSHTDNVHEFRAYVLRAVTAMLGDICDNLVQKGVLSN